MTCIDYHMIIETLNSIDEKQNFQRLIKIFPKLELKVLFKE